MSQVKQLKAKFECEECTQYPGWDSEKQQRTPDGYKAVKLRAVTGKNNAEDNQFSTATPFGEIKMNIDAPGAKDFIQPGKKYYVYFEECEDQS